MRKLLLVAVMVVTAASACSSSDEPVATASSPRSASSTPSTSSTPDASPTPSASDSPPSGDDARVLLEQGTVEEIRDRLQLDLPQLESVTAHIVGGDGTTIDIVIDSGGRCSGTIEGTDTDFTFVQGDGLSFITSDEPLNGIDFNGKWREVESSKLDYLCGYPPRFLIDQQKIRNQGTPLLMTGRRLGFERVSGRRTLHLRMTNFGRDGEIWVAAATSNKVWPVKVSTDSETSTFSAFNSSEPDPLPPETDRVAQPAA